MPKVLSSPKLPTGKGGGRRSFRLSPLEIGVAILVAMGGVYLIYILLSGLFGGGADSPAPDEGPLGQGINPARLDKVLTAAEAANRRILQLEKRLTQMDQRLREAGTRGGAPAAGGGEAKLAARVQALEKQLAALSAAPPAAGQGQDKGQAKAADPRLAARLDQLEKGLASLQKQNQKAAKSLEAVPDKLAPRLDQLEKSLAALDKDNQQMAKDLQGLKPAKGQEALAAKVAELEKQLKAQSQKSAAPPVPDKLPQRLDSLEKQVKELSSRPATGGAAPASDELAQRVTGQGKVLAGLSTSLGQLRRGQERLEKQVGALAVTAPPVKGAPLASPALANRLSSLEERIGELSKAQALPSRQALQASKRLDALEKELDQLRKQATTKADPKLNARLSSLEKQLAADDRDEQKMDQRLDRLEKKVSRVSTQAKAAPPPPAQDQPVRIIHTVRRGQTLYGLSRTYGVQMRQIREWNPQLGGRDKLYIGEKLTIVIRK